MSNAKGYKRLSQASDTSIQRQDDHIREYADEHGFNLIEVYNDGERSSGFDSTREQFQELREDISDGSIDAIIVNDKRRLARDFDATMRLILDCRENDIEIHTYQSGQLDISQPMNASIEVLMAASDYEAKKKEIAKAKEAVKERKEDGCYHGTPPFGLSFGPDKCHLQRDTEQWEIVCDVIDRRPEDNLEEIAEDTGLSPSTVSRIANRGVDWYAERLAKYG